MPAYNSHQIGIIQSVTFKTTLAFTISKSLFKVAASRHFIVRKKWQEWEWLGSAWDTASASSPRKATLLYPYGRSSAQLAMFPDTGHTFRFGSGRPTAVKQGREKGNLINMNLCQAAIVRLVSSN